MPESVGPGCLPIIGSLRGVYHKILRQRMPKFVAVVTRYGAHDRSLVFEFIAFIKQLLNIHHRESDPLLITRKMPTQSGHDYTRIGQVHSSIALGLDPRGKRE
jgi:hypothetical protein